MCGDVKSRCDQPPGSRVSLSLGMHSEALVIGCAIMKRWTDWMEDYSIPGMTGKLGHGAQGIWAIT